MKKLILLILFVGFCSYAKSAENNIEADIQRQAATKVAILNDFIKNIASKAESLEYRDYYRFQALKLFVNNGNNYNIYVTDKNNITHKIEKDGVTMQVTSVNHKDTTTLLLRNYLYRLARLKYDKVEIQSTEVSNIKVSNLYKIRNNEYVCTCFFKQAFIGYRDGVPKYKDITEKKIECRIRVEHIAGEPEPDYIILLGDITALDTQRIKSNNQDEIIDILNNL